MALKGIQVLEIAGLAPAPFCGMILSDFGAKVIRIDKIVESPYGVDNILAHGKFSVALNFKTPGGIAAFRKMSAKSDVVIDSYRPGVMENLGIGPSELMKDNKRLIYGRLSGYGQDGPLSNSAGHDINYIGMSGALSFLGSRETPIPPVNLLADFAGGGLTSALGIILALYERKTSGIGQIVDCSMTRGSAYVSSWLFRGLNTFLFSQERGENLLDGGYFFYNTYKTKDDKWMAVGALEPHFFNNMLKGLNISQDELSQASNNDDGRRILTKAFAEHTQMHWSNVFSSLDACVTPVLSPNDAVAHEHNQYQRCFDKFNDGTIAPTPEPRLSRTPTSRELKCTAPKHGEHTIDILMSIGYTKNEIRNMIELNSIGASVGTSKL